MERRTKHVKFPTDKQPQGMIDYEETKSQPILGDWNIRKKLIVELK